MRSFASQPYPTLGVEQEFHLIDPQSADLLPCHDAVREHLDARLRAATCYEVYYSVLETRSEVCRTVTELEESVTRDRKAVAKACEQAGALLVAAASHPFADWRKQPVVRDPHYQWVLREHGYLLQRLLSFGLHVHVGMRSAEAALYAMAEFRRWLYPLLALSANSPFYEGHRSGLASTRAHLFGSMPRTGLPPAFTTFAELEDFYEKLLAAGDLKKPGDLWWSIRPQPPLGTIEVRSYDLPTDVGRLAVLAAITQAAMATYQDRYFDGTRRSDLKREYLEQNRWKAMRYGLDANILEPETGEVLSVKGQLHRLLDFIAPKTEEIRSSTYLDRARDMISEGSEADRQVRTWESMDRDLRRLELDIALRTI